VYAYVFAHTPHSSLQDMGAYLKNEIKYIINFLYIKLRVHNLYVFNEFTQEKNHYLIAITDITPSNYRSRSTNLQTPKFLWAKFSPTPSLPRRPRWETKS
jgi:hypothetical protein